MHKNLYKHILFHNIYCRIQQLYRLGEDCSSEAQFVNVLSTFLPLCQVAAQGLPDGRKNNFLSHSHLGLMSTAGQ